MMQRGIPQRVAMQLMVFGFFEEVIEKIDSEELVENLRQLIHQKFSGKIS
jgi:Fe-S cluster assembly protein SufD